MLATIALALYGFVWGLRRGFSSCLALCIPVIIPALMSEKGGWRSGLKTAFLFNLPRILLLTILGLAIGAGGYAVGAGLESLTVGSTVWAVGYALVGCMMIVYGTYIFASMTERLDDLAEGKTECIDEAVHPVFSKLKLAAPRSKTGLVFWGGLVSVACIGETVLALEGLFVGIFTGGASASPLTAALIGGFAFFMFALGTAFPSMLIAAFGSRLADREKRAQRLLQVERLAGVLMIGFGAVFLLSALFVIP
jgi:hypothetical protein